MKVLDLFSGIGGFSLGLERAGMRTIAFCEIDKFCQRVLKKHWPHVPIFDDIRELKANELPEQPDVICGGFPCQPFSLAGKRRGKEDDRHIWPEMLRIINECRPQWVVGENVAGIINMELDRVLSDLENIGYTTWPLVIPACAVDAPHRRDRVWIVAHTECWWRRELQTDAERQSFSKAKRKESALGIRSGCKDVANAAGGGWREGNEDSGGVPERTKASQAGSGFANRSETDGCRWRIEPPVGRVVNGLSGRLGRLRALGNAVVPQIPEVIGRAIMQAESTRESA